MVVIEKIKTWKIFINKQPFVFDTINGLVKSIYIFPDIIKCEKKFILGWNVYSLIRFILENNKNIVFYRKKKSEWIKMNNDKIKKIAYSSLK